MSENWKSRTKMKLRNKTPVHCSLLTAHCSLFTVFRPITILILLAFLVAAAPAFSQQSPPWWLLLEQGKQLYRSGDYGRALLTFEDARRQRRAMYEQMERDLVNLLSVNAVRRIGDSLERVEQYSTERHYIAATAALNELYYRVPKASLNNSANAALEAIIALQDYPEAEYWIGEIYRVEGELSLALSQFRKAYELRHLMEDPGFALEIQYKIADILRTRQTYNEMIRTYEAIISAHDTIRIDARLIAQRENERRENPRIATPSFLELYRYNNNLVEPAHRHLGFHYAITGRPSALQHLMYALIIQNTIIIEEVKQNKFDFVFTDLRSLAQEIEKSPLLLSYIEEIEYYKTIYYLANSLYRETFSSAARSFWEFLATQPQAGEWHGRAVRQLQNPQMEPLVEMP